MKTKKEFLKNCLSVVGMVAMMSKKRKLELTGIYLAILSFLTLSVMFTTAALVSRVAGVLLLLVVILGLLAVALFALVATVRDKIAGHVTAAYEDTLKPVMDAMQTVADVVDAGNGEIIDSDDYIIKE